MFNPTWCLKSGGSQREPERQSVAATYVFTKPQKSLNLSVSDEFWVLLLNFMLISVRKNISVWFKMNVSVATNLPVTRVWVRPAACRPRLPLLHPLHPSLLLLLNHLIIIPPHFLTSGFSPPSFLPPVFFLLLLVLSFHPVFLLFLILISFLSSSIHLSHTSQAVKN